MPYNIYKIVQTKIVIIKKKNVPFKIFYRIEQVKRTREKLSKVENNIFDLNVENSLCSKNIKKIFF